MYTIIRARQSLPCIMLITFDSSLIVLIDASDMICKKTSTGKGVLRATAFANSLALAFLFLSIYSTLKPLKKFSILLTKARYFSRVGSLAMHSFSICPATTLESMRRMHLCTPMALCFRSPSMMARTL
jgi:hypothetical protein